MAPSGTGATLVGARATTATPGGVRGHSRRLRVAPGSLSVACSGTAATPGVVRWDCGHSRSPGGCWWDCGPSRWLAVAPGPLSVVRVPPGSLPVVCGGTVVTPSGVRGHSRWVRVAPGSLPLVCGGVVVCGHSRWMLVEPMSLSVARGAAGATPGGVRTTGVTPGGVQWDWGHSLSGRACHRASRRNVAQPSSTRQCGLVATRWVAVVR